MGKVAVVPEGRARIRIDPIKTGGIKMTNTISENGVKFIKSFEGFANHAYKPVSDEKYFTIGYGHYGADVRADQTITEPQAEQLLANDLQTYVNGVASLVKVSVNQNQFDALVSFAYNVGVGALGSSTLLKKLNAGDYAGASAEFSKWVYGAGGLALQGLVNRRAAEQKVFNTPVPQPAPQPVYHIVKAGENLSVIAKNNGLTLAQIEGLNQGINYNVIQVGQKIRIK